jgi:hypothetical protein
VLLSFEHLVRRGSFRGKVRLTQTNRQLRKRKVNVASATPGFHQEVVREGRERNSQTIRLREMPQAAAYIPSLGCQRPRAQKAMPVMLLPLVFPYSHVYPYPADQDLAWRPFIYQSQPHAL